MHITLNIFNKPVCELGLFLKPLNVFVSDLHTFNVHLKTFV